MTYTPNEWNLWPVDEPPKGYIMRIQDSSLGSFGIINRIYQCLVGYWDGTKWVDIDKRDEEIHFYGDHILYRPWDEKYNWLITDD